mmetsp:Transcript_43145/g.94027  ORF Transcript_43145/g.94027 Transcript_43145/m.94027 type:complete len:274 (-) Transcript_43145:1442-2263(-)
MIREWDDRRADPENHGWMNLCVRVGLAVRPRLRQILQEHGNHRALLLLSVQILNQALAHEITPLPFARSELGDVRLVDQSLLALVIHDVQGPHGSACIRRYPDLEVFQVLLDRDLRVDVLPPPQILQRVSQLRRPLVHAHPHSVQEDLGVFPNVDWTALEQIHDAPLVQEVLHYGLPRTKGDIAHQRDVFHQAHRLALRRLRWAHEAPVGVVKLPGLRQLPGARERSDHSPQVRQRGHEGQPVEPLGDTRPDRLPLLVLAPVARGKLVLHPGR